MLHKINKKTLSEIACIDQDAANIVSSAAKSYEAIIQARNILDNQGDHAQTLFVLAGETHTEVPHYLHHMLLIDALSKAQDNFAVALEIDHNIAPDDIGIITTPLTVDDRTIRNLNYTIDGITSRYCDYASRELSRALKRGLEQQRLKCLFSDCSKKPVQGMNKINTDDASTQKSCEAVKYTSDELCGTTTPTGMAIRNHHMYSAIRNYAEQSNIRIMYQCVGSDHLEGISKHFHGAGLPYFNLVHSSSIDRVQGEFINKSYLLLDELPKFEAYYIPGGRIDIDLCMMSDCLTSEDEQNYVEGKLNAMGLKL